MTSQIDLAVIGLPSNIIPKLIEECGQKGAKACVIVSGGFNELGENYKKIEEETVTTAREYKTRIIGPNCIGIFNSETKIDTFFSLMKECFALHPAQFPSSLKAEHSVARC